MFGALVSELNPNKFSSNRHQYETYQDSTPHRQLAMRGKIDRSIRYLSCDIALNPCANSPSSLRGGPYSSANRDESIGNDPVPKRCTRSIQWIISIYTIKLADLQDGLGKLKSSAEWLKQYSLLNLHSRDARKTTRKCVCRCNWSVHTYGMF